MEAKETPENEKVASADSATGAAARSRPATSLVEVEEKIAATEGARPEVSATTIGRLMGLATATDVNLLEGKLDMLVSKLNAMTIRVDKILTTINNAPTGSDLERIDVQIGALRTLVREALGQVAPPSSAQKANETAKAAEKSPTPTDAEKK